MLACMAAAVCGCAGPGLEITQAETEIGSTPVPDEQSWRADPRGWELAQVLRFHALGQPHELMYSGWVGADEVYRLEIDRSLGLYPKLIALVIRKGERVQFTVHRLHISWFGETAECIGRWRNEFQRRCEMPEARASVARDLSAAEWEELRAKIAAAMARRICATATKPAARSPRWRDTSSSSRESSSKSETRPRRFAAPDRSQGCDKPQDAKSLKRQGILERETGFEPATPSLGSLCSTN